MNLIAGHLLHHLQAFDLKDEAIIGLSGDFLPHSGAFAPVKASPKDEALFRLAMFTVARTVALDPSVREQARWAASEIPASDNPTKNSPIAESIDLALSTHPGESELGGAIAIMQDSDYPFLVRSIAAWAVARHAPEHTEVAGFLDASTRRTPSELMGALPWIGWTDVRNSEAQDMAPRLVGLWQLITLRMIGSLSEQQVPAADSLPAAAFIASVLNNPHIVPPSKQPLMREVLCRLLDHLDQLVLDENESRFFHPNAKGGVRLRPWNERMTIWAQTMAILMLHEAIEMLPSTVPVQE